MKLVISRGEQMVKGAFGGNKGTQFTLQYRLELTSEEAELVEHYRLGDYVVNEGSWDDLKREPIMHSNKLAELASGQNRAFTSLVRLLNEEAAVIGGCDQLPALFDYCRQFKNGRTVEYPRGNAG